MTQTRSASGALLCQASFAMSTMPCSSESRRFILYHTVIAVVMVVVVVVVPLRTGGERHDNRALVVSNDRCL